MTHDEIIAVVAAHRDGKTVQARIINGAGPWSDQTTPSWNFSACDYRIKPVLREWLICVRNGAVVMESVALGCAGSIGPNEKIHVIEKIT